MPAQRPITGTRIDNGQPYTAYAWGDGTNDDRATLQTALDTCGAINVPAGTYKITGTLTVPNRAGAGIKGVSLGSMFGGLVNAGVVFLAAFATGTAITSLSASPVFENFEVLRATGYTASSGSYGLDLGAACSSGSVKNVWSHRHYRGFYLRSTGTGTAQNLRAENNISHGFEIKGKFNFSQALAQANGGDGFRVVGNNNDCGAYKWLGTYLNGGHGIYFSGTVRQIRLNESFFGQDGGNEIYVDNINNAGQSNEFINVHAEDPGNIGFLFGANTVQNNLYACASGGAISGGYGVYSDAPALGVSGGQFSNSSNYGILCNGASNFIQGVVTKNCGIAGIGASANVTSLMTIGNWFSASATPMDVSLASGKTHIGDY